MDRQPQHPFARNTSSPYGRPPFQQSSNQAPFPPSSHPPNGPHSYPEHQRRPSEPGYYAPSRSYPQEAPPMPAPSHSRHPSSSSISHSTPVSRNMPPPSSPQQQQQSQHTFPPPLPRGPPPSLGAPISSLTANRDLPTLPPPLPRPGSSMSISSMLGNPAPSTREPTYPPSQFPGPLPFSNAAHPSTSFPGSRSLISIAEPTSFRRQIRTPEPARSQERHGPRDSRANSAGSPPRGPSMLTSPDVNRYGTPQNYPQRPAQGPQITQGEERRDTYPVRVPNTSLPPRPNSQPAGFSAPPPQRPVDTGRSEMPPYGRSGYGDREPAYAYAERERQEKEAAMQRDREREREHREREHREREHREREHREREHREREREREFKREGELHPDRERQGTEAAIQREAMQRERDRRDFEDRSRIYAAERGRQELLEREQARAQDLALSRELEQRERDRENDRREYMERENERVREREMAERERANALQGIPPSYTHQQSQHVYNRQYEPREQQHLPWARPGYEQPPPDSISQPQVHPSYEPPRNAPSTYPAAPSTHASHPPNDARYPPASQAQSGISHHGPAPAPQNYEGSLHDRQRREMAQSQQPFSYGGAGGHNGPSLYQPQESPKRKQEDELKMIQQQQQQRERERAAHLGVGQHEINRRGRLSPLPQAVQGAQVQSNSPSVEPRIKNEFGRMFSGIGSGALGMATTAATPSTSHTPFSNPRHSHREDLDSANAGHETNGESAHKVNNSSRGGRRRKLKDEDSRDEDGSSTGRRTPSIRGSSKRPKANHPPGGSSNNIHAGALTHRRVDTENTSSPANGTPFKINSGVNSPSEVKSGMMIPHHHHVVRTHHHHHHHPAPQPHRSQTGFPLAGPTIPKPKSVIRSKAVIDSVAHYPRYHLGSTVYSSDLRPSNTSVKSAARARASRRGYSSTPTPLPRFDGNENCTFTIQVPHVYLSKESREEITARRPVWGTDVYTDDSDVIAACIHAGWIRGEWPEDVDISMLELEIDAPDAEVPATTANGKNTRGKDVLTKAPPKGPMIPPGNKDLHVTILLLPTLEKYSSVTRFGLKSREWGDNHDGLSFMILSMKWVDVGDIGRGKVGRRMRLIVAEEERIGEDEREKELFGGTGRDPHAMDLDVRIEAQESFVRGDGAAPLVGSRFKGLGVGSWWNKDKGKEQKPLEKAEAMIEVEVKEQDNKAQEEKEVPAVGVDIPADKELELQEKSGAEKPAPSDVVPVGSV